MLRPESGVSKELVPNSIKTRHPIKLMPYKYQTHFTVIGCHYPAYGDIVDLYQFEVHVALPSYMYM